MYFFLGHTLLFLIVFTFEVESQGDSQGSPNLTTTTKSSSGAFTSGNCYDHADCPGIYDQRDEVYCCSDRECCEDASTATSYYVGLAAGLVSLVVVIGCCVGCICFCCECCRKCMRDCCRKRPVNINPIIINNGSVSY